MQRLQVDEVHSFVYAKHANVRTAKKAPETCGDVWTWTALDADTKLIASFYVGDRDYGSARAFIEDLATRLANRVQLTSDGLRSYLHAIERVFGEEIDYSILVKIYGPEYGDERRYSPPKCLGTKRTVALGNPDPAHISTSFVETQNLTMRMHMRLFTRLTNGFSKKVENHACAIALHRMFYNFVRVHSTLKTTRAMAAGVTKRLWEMTDIVDLTDA